MDEIKQTDQSLQKQKNIFKIEKRIDRYHFVMDVNMKLLQLPMELNQLKIIGIKNISITLGLKAHDFVHMLPLANCFQESLRTFEYTENRIMPNFAPLVAEIRLSTQQKMLKGLEIQWKNELAVDKYAKELREAVSEFEDVVNEVIEKTSLVDQFIEEFQTSELDQEVLAGKIDKIQKIIDEFDTKSYSNLQLWVNELDKRISDILTDRLEKRVQRWVKEFTSPVDDEERELVDRFTLKIKMRNQTFALDPPMPQARAYFFSQLHKEIQIICGLRKIEAYRYTKYKGIDNKRDKTYRGLLKQMKNFSMTEAYEAIGKTLDEAENYFGLWKQY